MDVTHSGNDDIYVEFDHSALDDLPTLGPGFMSHDAEDLLDVEHAAQVKVPVVSARHYDGHHAQPVDDSSESSESSDFSATSKFPETSKLSISEELPAAERSLAATPAEPLAEAQPRQSESLILDSTGIVAPRAAYDLDDLMLAARAKLAAAQDRLDHAQAQSQAIIADAIEQGSLISRSAETAAESLIPAAEKEADAIIAQANKDADEIRRQAEQQLIEAREVRSNAHIGLDDELQLRRDEHEQILRTARELHEDELARSAAQAEQDFIERHAAALAKMEQMLRDAKRELADAAVDSDMMRADARKEARALVESARVDASKELAAAAEQTQWAQQIVTQLVAAAETDAERIRRVAHLDAGKIAHQVRERITEQLEATEEDIRQRLAAAEAEAAALHAAAKEDRQLATEEAERTRAKAEADAERVRTDADDLARTRIDVAERRLAEAENGARAVRERIADEVSRSQWTAHELRRASKAEATQVVSEAREEADELRQLARQLLTDARAELVVLTERRDAIAAELGTLSGVIEALAVPDPTATGSTAAGSTPVTSEKHSEPVKEPSETLPHQHVDDESEEIHHTDSSEDAVHDTDGHYDSGDASAPDPEISDPVPATATEMMRAE